VDVDQINSYFDLIEQAARIQALLVFIRNSYIPLILIILALIIGIIFAARKARFIFIVLGITFSVIWDNTVTKFTARRHLREINNRTA
jgi:uncharacterized membrane protein